MASKINLTRWKSINLNWKNSNYLKRFTLLSYLILGSIETYLGQTNPYRVILKPDMKVDFPTKPKNKSKSEFDFYSSKYKETDFIAYSEKYPIDYRGRYVHVADSEFYLSYNKKLIEYSDYELISEQDTTLYGFKVRNISFYFTDNEGSKKLPSLSLFLCPDSKMHYMYLKSYTQTPK